MPVTDTMVDQVSVLRFCFYYIRTCEGPDQQEKRTNSQAWTAAIFMGLHGAMPAMLFRKVPAMKFRKVTGHARVL